MAMFSSDIRRALKLCSSALQMAYAAYKRRRKQLKKAGKEAEEFRITIPDIISTYSELYSQPMN